MSRSLSLPLPQSGTGDLVVHVEPADGDAALVAAAQRDPRAFAPLYLRYVDPVYAYCHRRLGSREAAEDATSLVFTKALAALPRYRTGGGTFRSWLFTIAHNTVIDSRRAAPSTRPLAEDDDLRARDPGPEEAVIAADEGRRTRALLARMTPDQRRVLELRLAGLSTAEIGAVLGRRPGAVRAVQFRAAARLRDLLAPEPTEESHRG